jgi:internalin A
VTADDHAPLTVSELRAAKHARTLDLSSRGLDQLPPEIGELKKLQWLNLNGNRLTDLPEEVTKLANLEGLGLEGNQLSTLPTGLGKLVNLRELRLEGNRLSILPPEIARLTKLQALILDGNRLTCLPPQFRRLTNLRELALNGNRLGGLPSEVTALTGLRTLGLSENQVSQLPPEIGGLTNLQTLGLNRNRLTGLPPEIGRLTNLQRLGLEDNRLSSLPPEVGQLIELRELRLNGNVLVGLPRELAKPLARGLLLAVQDNPLEEPFSDIVSRGNEALAAFLDSLLDAVPQFEAKVLLVGEGKVGKTSLVAALLGEGFVENRDTTHGIEIRSLAIPHPTQEITMTLRAWDFGGQEVYRITHQFFFSDRALYLVVWNAREGQEQNEVEGWLRRIRLRVGSNAPTLLIATHCDERKPELNYPRFRQMFSGMVAGRHQIDNRSGNGIAELRQAIADEASGLPQMGKLLSVRWTAARDAILEKANTEPQIAFDQFKKACQHHKMDGKEITTLAQLLHDLGQIIYYGDDEGLRDIVVLNPEWLTKAISYVLEDGPTREAQGVLDHTRLGEIWQDRVNGPTYPTRYHPYFLRLMEKFDVSYRLEGDDRHSLVAQLVPYEQPDLPWDATSPLPEGVRGLSLICELSEPAPGLMAWLTVRHHRASTGKHWREGVFLRHPISLYASEALLELRDDRHLAVQVRAPSPDLFFNVVRDSVEDLIARRWPGLQYQLMIPCPAQFSDNSGCSGTFRLETLLRRRERGRSNITCQECDEDHDIARLLTGFAVPATPLQPELERLQSQLIDLGRGVDRLERYAAATADGVRRILKAVGNEVPDCPRLFTLTPEQPSGTSRARVHRNYYKLVLWCEHPGQWHPWPAATYHIHQPKEWLVRVGPYANLVLKALRLVVPVAIAGITFTGEELRYAAQELDAMKRLVDILPRELEKKQVDLQSPELHGSLTPAEGAALRAVRVLLFKQDEPRVFGRLRRVHAPSGDFLWVCTDHYPEYDPGLPSLPSS